MFFTFQLVKNVFGNYFLLQKKLIFLPYLFYLVCFVSLTAICVRFVRRPTFRNVSVEVVLRHLFHPVRDTQNTITNPDKQPKKKTKNAKPDELYYFLFQVLTLRKSTILFSITLWQEINAIEKSFNFRYTNISTTQINNSKSLCHLSKSK